VIQVLTLFQYQAHKRLSCDRLLNLNAVTKPNSVGFSCEHVYVHGSTKDYTTRIVRLRFEILKKIIGFRPTRIVRDHELARIEICD
jgi:hypothetical protein